MEHVDALSIKVMIKRKQITRSLCDQMIIFDIKFKNVETLMMKLCLLSTEHNKNGDEISVQVTDTGAYRRTLPFICMSTFVISIDTFLFLPLIDHCIPTNMDFHVHYFIFHFLFPFFKISC